MTQLSARIEGASTVVEAIANLEQFLAVPTNALKRIGAYQERQFQKAFDANRTPEGNPWPPLAASTKLAKRNPKMLVERVGRIPGSLFWELQGDSVVVGYADPLANLHDAGGKSSPHRIVPKTKKALYWKGAKHPVRSVNHPGSVLPARRLVGYSPADVAEWQAIIEEEATKKF